MAKSDYIPPRDNDFLNRPLLAAGKPELRHYKAVYVSGDTETGLFSDDVVVNCQP